MDNPPHMLVAEFYSDTGWSIDKLKQWVLDHVIARIGQQWLFPELADDMVWIPSASRHFSVNSTWECLRQTRSSATLFRMIWNEILPLKVSFFAWRVLHNWLPLDATIRTRGVVLASCCHCCRQEEESLNHLFLQGPVASRVWEHFGRRFGILDVVRYSLSSVWMSWNRARFENLAFDAQQVIVMINSFVDQLGAAGILKAPPFKGDSDVPWAAWVGRRARRVECRAVSWQRPPLHHYKLNTDAIVYQGRASGGGLLCDTSGNLIFAFYKEFGEANVLMAESLSLLHGLLLCSEWHVQNLLVEVDSELLDSSSPIRHVFREGNGTSDKLAGLRLPNNSFFPSYLHLSVSVRTSLLLDSRGFPHVRLCTGL
ncbi:uncharacterized protein LOC113777304 [Coffea eugenioides]|uniref:uncharacterized protein LOC113777304 n=1 Tax=Coffea eugenioides TaxID=49369 RepID=UPI000F60B1C6|nr:uncharacterized protein LOC113777304 [Coffea eugenioides]